MFQAPINNCIIQVTTKYIKNISDILKLAHIHNAQLDPNNYVNTVGTIVSIPKRITTEIREYEGFSTRDIYDGDCVFFRYDVVGEFIHNPGEELPIFKNEIWYKGHTYFAADIQKIFGVVRGGDIIMVNGYCRVEQIAEESPILLPQHLKKSLGTGSAMLTAIGNPLIGQKRIDAHAGDIVYFNKNHLQIYQVSGKPYGIIHQRQILGYSAASYEQSQNLVLVN